MAEKYELTEKEFKAANATGAEKMAKLPKAARADYDKKSRRFVLEMQNGVTLLVPAGLIQGLQSGDDEALRDFDLVAQGSQIHWHRLDVQFYVKSLLEGVFGTPNWMSNLNQHLAAIGAKGGASRSEAKKISSRENGKKGGRPRKQKAA